MAIKNTYLVKNKLGIRLTLVDGQGDEVQIPPLTTAPVDRRFIDFQLPAIQQAEVLGYDYSAMFQPKAVVAEPKAVAPTIQAPAPAPVPVPAPSSDKQDKPSE